METQLAFYETITKIRFLFGSNLLAPGLYSQPYESSLYFHDLFNIIFPSESWFNKFPASFIFSDLSFISPVR